MLAIDGVHIFFCVHIDALAHQRSDPLPALISKFIPKLNFAAILLYTHEPTIWQKRYYLLLLRCCCHCFYGCCCFLLKYVFVCVSVPLRALLCVCVLYTHETQQHQTYENILRICAQITHI